MITDIDDYFTKGCGRCDRFDTPDCSTRFWVAGLNDLRRICRDMGLIETVKWAHPCYMAADRNVVMIGAFLSNFVLTFFNPALMTDPDGVLEPAGPNAQHPSLIRFTDVDEVAKREVTIRAYLAEAIGYAKAGILPEKTVSEIEIPDELTEAMDGDPELAEAFNALTPGRQKSYAFALNSTANPSTRFARIARFRDKIIAGKGALDR